ncbi:MAG TPA: low affinity iron permease family protein [Candidatus Eisenbacteria bacterium]|nr:low affinity iron permease family protein [Candidatus Eisenbacteria bacterium]
MSRSSLWTRINHAVARFSSQVTTWSGGTLAFGAAFTLIVAWLVAGPLFGFSDSWQLVINTTTTIVTFLMVFLIQRAQNKEARATSIKLNEILAAIDGASNRLIDVEDLSEEELDTLHRHFQSLASMAKREGNLTRSHSIEEAKVRHHAKSHRPARGGARNGRAKRGGRGGRPGAPTGRAESA